MKITRFRVRNYRTLEDIELAFPSSYTAICGANDSGKTNVVRAIRALMKEENLFLPFYEEPELSVKDDFPKWKDTDPAQRSIELSLQAAVHRERDAGLYQAVVKQLSIEDAPEVLELTLSVSHTAEKPEERVRVRVGETEFDGLDAQEVLKRFQTSRSVLFHNSTQATPPPLGSAEGWGTYGRYLRKTAIFSRR